MRTEDIEKLALAYTEKEYYKVDDKDELNGEPLAVFKAYCQALSVFQELQDNSDKKYTLEDIKTAYDKGMDYNADLLLSSNLGLPKNGNEYIQSLNKQD